MGKIVIKPGTIGAIALWLGSDQYVFLQALRREEFSIGADKIKKIYTVEADSILGLRKTQRFAIEYTSGHRDCLISVEKLPETLHSTLHQRISPLGIFALFLKSFWKEPSAILYPLILPFLLSVMMFLFGVWNDQILHNPSVLDFFAKPGCDAICVRKVLSIHSLVVLLFLLQGILLFLPWLLLFIQAPKYKSALNYRITQIYSVTAMVIGAVVFVQLLMFFPFKQYGKFLELGFDPKVERMLANIKEKK